MMRENVATQDRIIRSITGTALIAIGSGKSRGKKGRAVRLSAMIFGAILIKTAITKVCPLKAFIKVNAQRKNDMLSRCWYALQQGIFSSHRRDLLNIEGESIEGNEAARPKQLSNFGKNVRFNPEHFYAPKDEAEVLTILDRHNKQTIRAIGSLHAWSDIAVSDGVTVDLRHFNQVKLERKEGEVWATVGAGCRLQDLLHFLQKRAGVTLPTVSAVTEQTIAGAISTATHGSGMPSISHFIEEVKTAAYDQHTGEARIYEWKDGPTLRAARCGLGCTGVILSVRFRCVSSYTVEQSVSRVKTIDEVLASEEDFPLQQTILIPYAWEYFVYKRRAVDGRRSRTSWITYLFRAHWFVIVDVLFHANLIPLVNLIRNRRVTRFYLKHLTPAMLWKAPLHTGNSAEILVLEHELFEHVEMEIFVPARHIRMAVKFLQEVISMYSGDIKDVSPQLKMQLESIGMLGELNKNCGTYFHHMPFLIRRILPDDTLISMTSAAEEPYYSISVFSYYKDRSKIYPLADFLAHSMNRLYSANLHWGKYFPLNNTEIEPLYPKLKEFREICRRIDPNGNFRNSYTKRILGFVEN